MSRATYDGEADEGILPWADRAPYWTFCPPKIYVLANVFLSMVSIGEVKEEITSQNLCDFWPIKFLLTFLIEFV